MKTKIDLSYDRRNTEGKVAGILDRASTSVSVLKPPRLFSFECCFRRRFLKPLLAGAIVPPYR